MMYLEVDDSIFFGLSVNEFQGVCGHVHTYDHMCEYTHNNADALATTVEETDT
jgi:hypothetical protein